MHPDGSSASGMSPAEDVPQEDEELMGLTDGEKEEILLERERRRLLALPLPSLKQIAEKKGCPAVSQDKEEIVRIIFSREKERKEKEAEEKEQQRRLEEERAARKAAEKPFSEEVKRGYIHLMQCGDLRSLVAVARLLLDEGRIKEVQSAVHEAIRTARNVQARRGGWEVMDALISLLGESFYEGVIQTLPRDVTRFMPVHTDPTLYFEMTGRWWKVLPLPTMQSIYTSYPHPNKPPPPPEVQQKIRKEEERVRELKREREEEEYRERKKKQAAADEVLQEGNTALDTGDSAKAVERFTEYQKMMQEAGMRENPQCLVFRCEAYLKLREFDKAMGDAELVIRRNPRDWEGFELQGLALRGKEDLQGAEKAFDEALSRKPGRRDKDRIKKRLKEVKNDIFAIENPDKAVPEFKVKANECYVNDDFKSAEYYFTKLIALDESMKIIYLSNRSAARSRMKYFEEALEDAEEVVKMRPDWAKGYLRKGLALLGLRKYDEALVSLKKGLEIEPWHEVLQRLHEKAISLRDQKNKEGGSDAKDDDGKLESSMDPDRTSSSPPPQNDEG